MRKAGLALAAVLTLAAGPAVAGRGGGGMPPPLIQSAQPHPRFPHAAQSYSTCSPFCWLRPLFSGDSHTRSTRRREHDHA
ncbi:MAG: hypothetical protein M3Y41_11000 [Pseudomonadota bacterium]|nr:hypothetical protein [Pseudomonadota bacterium]